jgi:hypothetical protein
LFGNLGSQVVMALIIDKICVQSLPAQILIDLFATYVSVTDLKQLRLLSKFMRSYVDSACVLSANREEISSILPISSFVDLRYHFIPRIFLIGGIPDIRRVDIFYPESKRFGRGGSLGLKRNQEFDAVFHQGNIFVLSGCTDSSIGKVESYDFISNSWTEVCPLPKPVVAFAAVSFRKRLLCLGGYDHTNFQRISTIYEYQPSIESSSLSIWEISSFIQPLNTPRAYHAAIVYRDQLLVAGGVISGQATNSVEVYNPDSNTWTTFSPMKRNRRDFRLVIADGSLFAVGGDMEGIRNTTCTIERYDTKRKTWTMEVSFPYNRIKNAVCSYGCYILIFGDCSNPSIPNNSSWDVYNVRQGTWVSASRTIAYDTKDSFVKHFMRNPTIMADIPGRRQGFASGVALTVCLQSWV